MQDYSSARNRLNRRRFLHLSSLTAGAGLLLAACGDTATPTSSGAATTAAGAATTAAGAAATTAAGAATTATTGATTTAAVAGATTSSGILTMPQGMTTFQRNFNPFASSPVYPTLNGIYEPLMIYSTLTGKLIPWLATEYKWSADNKNLTFTLQENVKWSDGKPFSASDVAFTFNLLRNKTGLIGPGNNAMNTASGFVDTVTASDARTVVFTLKQPFTPGIYDIAGQMIVPEHIWKDIADPSKSTNDNPVATGPFTQITNFQTQVVQVEKNPNYWQPGKPYIQGVRILGLSGDQIHLAVANGQVDLAADFLPDIEKVFVAKSPSTNGYWFPLTGQMVTLALNNTKKPFDDPNVRKAISYALNRNQMNTVAESGYSKPADVTGLSDGHPLYKVADPSKLGDWTNYNVARANELLDAAGLKKGGNGMRTNPDGTPLKFVLTNVNGFTDWIAAGQIIVQNLKAVGIELTVTQVDFSGWIGLRQRGQFDITFNTVPGATPYQWYRNAMAKTLLKPVGEVSSVGNYARYSGGKADDLLAEFASTSDLATQKEIAAQLQKVFADEAPLLPLWPLPMWYQYNTTRFTGFPTKDNPYIPGQYGGTGQDNPGALLIWTTVKPK